MTVKKGKPTLRIAIIAVSMLIVLLAFVSTVDAADILNDTWSGVKISTNNSSCDISSYSSISPAASKIVVSISAEKNDSSSTTLSFESTNDEPTVVSFDYKIELSSGSATLDTVNVSAGEYSLNRTISKSEKIEFALSCTSSSGASSAKITITNLSIVIKETRTISLNPPIGGQYSVSTTNSDTGIETSVTMTSTDVVTSFSYISTDGINLTASQDAGNNFFAWRNGNAIISQNSNDTISSYGNGDLLSAEFISDSTVLPFSVGSITFYCWEDAMNAAYVSSGTVVVNRDYTLPAIINRYNPTGDYVKSSDGIITYTIPSGVTLLVPFDAAGTVYYSDNLPPVDYNKTTVPSAYRTLTIPNNVSIEINNGGLISVPSKLTAQGQTNGNNGGPYDKHGKVVLDGENSGIILRSGSELAVFGYITGSGMVEAESGSLVYECFQIRDWHGGTGTSWMKNDGIFPFSQYYIQNIESKLKLEAGAIEKTITGVNGSRMAVSASVEFIGPAGMFNMSTGYLIKQYLVDEDRLSITLYDCEASLSSISVSTSMLDVDSSDFILPLNGNMSINICDDSKVTLTQDLAMMAGAALNVENGSELTIDSGTVVFVYDNAEGSTSVCTLGYVASTSNNKPTTRAALQDASMNINGTINVYGELYTTATGANIYSGDGTGKIVYPEGVPENNVNVNIVNPGIATNASEKRADNYTVSTATPAQIRDENGDLHPTAGLEPDTTVRYATDGDHGQWYTYGVDYVSGSDPILKHYIVGTEDTLTAAELVSGTTRRYVTAYSVKNNDDDSANTDVTATGWYDLDTDSEKIFNPSVSLGWENIDLAGIEKDITVDLTLAPFTSRIEWVKTDKKTSAVTKWANYTNSSNFTFISDENDTFTVVGDPVISTLTEGVSVAGVVFAPDYSDEDFTKLALTNLPAGDVKVAMTTNTDFVVVVWNVDYPDQTDMTVKHRVDTTVGTTDTLTWAQPDSNAYYILDGDTSGTDLSENAYPVKTAKESATLSSITDARITVNLTLSKYANKVLYNVTVNNDAQQSEIVERFFTVYTNEASTTKNYTAHYIFNTTGNTADGATISANTRESLTVGTFTKRDVTVNVGMTYYDWKVTFMNGSNEISHEYVLNGGAASANLPANIAYTNISITGTATDASVNARPDAVATLGVTGVGSNAVLTATTRHFDYIVDFSDGTSTVQTDYIDDGENASFDASLLSGKYYVTAIVDSDGTVITNADGTLNTIAQGCRTLDVGNVDRNTTVVLTLSPFVYQINWDAAFTGTEVVEHTRSFVSDASATYYAPTGARYGHNHWIAKTYNGIVTMGKMPKVVNTYETFTISSFESDVTVPLVMAYYDYRIEFNDLQNHEVFFVDGETQNDIIINNIVRHTPASGYVMTGAVMDDPAAATMSTPATLREGGNVWESITLTDIAGDATIDVTTLAYEYKVTWRVGKDGGAASPVYDYVTSGTSLTYTQANAGGQYAIYASSGDGTTSADKLTHSISGIDADKTATLVLRSFDYVVTVNGAIPPYYVKNNNDVFTGANVNFSKSGKVITAVSGDTENVVMNDSFPAKVGGTDENVRDELILTEVTGDADLTVTLAAYDHKNTWTGEVYDQSVTRTSTVNEIHYITGATDSYTVGDGYNFRVKNTTNGTASAVGSGGTLQVTGLTANATITFDARNYAWYVIWSENGEAVRTDFLANAGDTATYTVPARSGNKFVITDVETEGAFTNENRSNIIYSIVPSSDVSVNVKTAQSIDGWDAIFGEMSFEMYKSGYVYRTFEGSKKWAPMATYGWRHTTGSVTETRVVNGVETEFIVDNGSILILNPSNQIIDVTVDMEKTGSTGADLNFSESAFRLAPGESKTVSATIVFETDNITLDKVEIGTINVTYTPID